MRLNELGLIAYECWKDIPKHFKNVILDEFVIMPDHMHGILILEKGRGDRDSGNLEGGGAYLRTGVALLRPYGDKRFFRPKIENPDSFFSAISPKPESLGAIIRSYKGAVARKIHQEYPGANFYWHRSYHDRIIRDEEELRIKRRYIRQNPRKWKKK